MVRLIGFGLVLLFGAGSVSAAQRLESVLTVPDDRDAPLRDIISGKTSIDLRTEAYTTSARMVLFRSFDERFTLRINLDGGGQLYADAKNPTFGVRLPGTITVDFGRGFVDPVLRLNSHVRVNLGGVLSADLVSVSLVAQGDSIEVTGKGFGEKVTFRIRPGEDLGRRLTEEFRRKSDRLVERIVEALSRADPLGRGRWTGRFLDRAGRDLDPFNRDSVLRRAARQMDPTDRDAVAGKFFRNLDPNRGPLGDFIKNRLPDFRFRLQDNGFDTDVPWPPRGSSAVALVAGEREAAFAEGLLKVVAGLQDVRVEEALWPVSSPGKEGLTARNSAVEARILAPTLAAPADDEILIGFAIKTTGSASTFTPRGREERRTGSEIMGGAVRLTKDSARPGRWKARIDLPSLNWNRYSYQNLSGPLVARIAYLLEALLPEVDVQGPQRWGERQLILSNATSDTLRVRLQQRTRVRTANGFDWRWLPEGAPKQDRTYTLTLKAGDKVKVTGEMVGVRGEQPFSASRVRLWAESGRGDRWLDHRDRDLWLVEPNPQLDDQRAYLGAERGTFTYTFRPGTGLRVFRERLVSLKNDTDMRMSVRLEYRSVGEGEPRWEKLGGKEGFEIEPGKTYEVRDKTGRRIQAQALKILAGNMKVGYRTYAEDPLWIVEEQGGDRLYRANQMGTFMYVFKPLMK